MNAHSETTFLRRISGPIAAAPSVLIAYTIFAVIVTGATYVLVAWDLRSQVAQIVPYTGWSMCMSYPFTIFFAFVLIYQQLVPIGYLVPLALYFN